MALQQKSGTRLPCSEVASLAAPAYAAGTIDTSRPTPTSFDGLQLGVQVQI